MPKSLITAESRVVRAALEWHRCYRVETQLTAPNVRDFWKRWAAANIASKASIKELNCACAAIRRPTRRKEPQG